LLRGKPEPALLIAAYRSNGSHPASLVGRALVRPQLKNEIPCSVSLGERELHYDARFAITERIVLLAFALEENSGEGVAALFAALETPEQLLLYSASQSVPSPLTVDEWSRTACRAPSARAVEVMRSGRAVEEIVGSDQFISASAFSLAAQGRADESWRLPFVGRDERNDWTLLLRTRID